jgi:stearoyl-CoA desaturase (delta-9 desaturase)
MVEPPLLSSVTPPQKPTGSKPVNWSVTLLRWFDNEAGELPDDGQNRKLDWLRTLPFIALHLACLAVFWVGISPIAVVVAMGLYALRMFAITGFYHRYFSHKAFRTSRPMQFLFALVGASAVQRGPLWWASHHRHHHVHSDEDPDVHSPVRHGFLWSHMGWFLCRVNFRTRAELVKDWLKFPELRFLDRFDVFAPMLLAISLYGLGELIEGFKPGWGTNGPQMLVWGFVISTIVLYHATFMVNSLAHVWGWRRYATRDTSRNNPVIALFTLGEGWHNNHHHYPASARQGFFWWEFDPTYYALRIMATLGLVWDLKPLPASLRQARRSEALPATRRLGSKR